MSWSDYEYSTASGQPVRLYEFIRGGTRYYRYTNADRAVTAGGQTWAAIAISDGGIASGTDDDDMTITLPADNPVAELYDGVPPSRAIRLKIHELHYGDADVEVKTRWVGTLTNRQRSDAGVAKLSAVSLAATFGRTGVRLTWGRGCPYALYDHNCRLKSADYAVSLSITSTDGNGITVNIPAGVPEGYFSGGYIEFTAGGVTETRGARVHSGNVINLFGGSTGLTVGQAVTVYPGCDLTAETCDAKFGNILNFGGINHLPSVNPWQIIKVF